VSLFTVLVGSKIAVGVLALSTIAIGGTAAAAYTGSLPAPLQDTAHVLVGAPSPSPDSSSPLPVVTDTPTDNATDEPVATETPEPTSEPTSTAAPVGPDATGPAAHGLCTAYTHGGLAPTSVAYTALVKAAGGASNVIAYCASIAAPGHSGSHGASAVHSKAKPSTSGVHNPGHGHH
jgi:hypothetical protein